MAFYIPSLIEYVDFFLPGPSSIEQIRLRPLSGPSSIGQIRLRFPPAGHSCAKKLPAYYNRRTAYHQCSTVLAV